MHSIVPRPSPKLTSKVKKTRTTRKPKKSTRLSKEEREELSRLASILPPSIRVSNPRSEPTRVLQDTVAYIDELMHLVSARINQGSLSREALSQLPMIPRCLSESISNQSLPKKGRSLEKRP